VFTTRLFEDGDGQAVLIPDEIAFEDMSKDLTITRHGDVIVIYPASGSLKGTFEKLRAEIPGLKLENEVADG
jgi:virulence-associated protein VagC